MSLLEWIREQQQVHRNVHVYKPGNNSDPVLDPNLQEAGVVNTQGLGSRQADLVSNTGKVCISERNIVERSFARNFDLKITGNKTPVPHQYTEASGTMPTPDLPSISIWLDVTAVLRREFKPHQLTYRLPPGVSYSDHGRDLRLRYTIL